ncbi:MAG: hypothetical protein HC837_18070, partial [Chloroflexaceae bacterium]|nr:hypothetical protein [Chloroflexaceae bacterium]
MKKHGIRSHNTEKPYPVRMSILFLSVLVPGIVLFTLLLTGVSSTQAGMLPTETPTDMAKPTLTATTVVSPTATEVVSPTATATAVPPTATATATDTAVPPTA